MTESVVHHVALGARDVRALSAFYEQALGLRRVREHVDESGELRSIWLSLQQTGPTHGVLMIEKTLIAPPAPGAPMQVMPGWFLLAFSVPSDERERYEARLLEAGATLEGRSAASSYVRDPEGNRLAISCYPLAGVCDSPPRA